MTVENLLKKLLRNHWHGKAVQSCFLSDSAQLKFRSFIHQATLASLDLVDVKSFLLFAAADENWFLCLGMVHWWSYIMVIGGKTGKTVVLSWFCKIEHGGGGGSGGTLPCYDGLSLSGHACRAGDPSDCPSTGSHLSWPSFLNLHKQNQCRVAPN